MNILEQCNLATSISVKGLESCVAEQTQCYTLMDKSIACKQSKLHMETVYKYENLLLFTYLIAGLIILIIVAVWTWSDNMLIKILCTIVLGLIFIGVAWVMIRCFLYTLDRDDI